MITKPRVLVIDKTWHFLESYPYLHVYYHVDVLHTIQQGLDAAESQSYDLIIINDENNNHSHSPYGTCLYFKQAPATAITPLLLISSFKFEREINQSLGLLGIDFLDANKSCIDLLSTMSNLLKRFRERKNLQYVSMHRWLSPISQLELHLSELRKKHHNTQSYSLLLLEIDSSKVVISLEDINEVNFHNCRKMIERVLELTTSEKTSFIIRMDALKNVLILPYTDVGESVQIAQEFKALFYSLSNHSTSKVHFSDEALNIGITTFLNFEGTGKSSMALVESALSNSKDKDDFFFVH